MSIRRIVLAMIVAILLSNAAMAQREETGLFEATIEETTEEAVLELDHAHAPESIHGSHAESAHASAGRPVTVRTAPEQASATLKNVTWELLSRMAAQLLSGNRAALLSGNEPEVLSENQTNLASGNKVQLLSGNHVSMFSNIQIDIHISGVPNPAEVMSGSREIRIEARPMVRPELRDERDRPQAEFQRPVPDVDVDRDRAFDSPRDE